MVALKVARLSATSPAANARLEAARLSATGPALQIPALRVARLSADGPAAILIDVIPDQTSEPEVKVTINPQLAGGGEPDGGWTVTQVSGPSVTLSVAADGTTTYTAPSTMTGTLVIVGFVATSGGIASTQQRSTTTVRPQQFWVLNTARTAWIGRKPATPFALSGTLSTRNYPAATPLINGNPWEQVQLPRVRGTIVNRINGLTSSIPGTAGPSGLAVPSTAMKVELFAHSNGGDVSSTATAGASEIDTVIQLNTGTVPVFAYDFLLNNRTNEKLRVASSYTSGTSVPVIRGTQGYSVPTAIVNGDTFRINGGDVSDSGGNYDTSRSEVRGDYASPSSTVPRLWPHPYNSVRFLDFQIMLPTSLFPTPTGTDWVVLTQWKGQFGGSPPVSLEASTAGTFKLQLGAAPDINFGNLTRNVWHRITLGTLLSPDPAAGWVEVWFEGVNVIARRTVATMEYQSDGVTPDPVYLKQGIYKPKEWAADHTAYFGPLAIADSGAPFGAV